MKHLLNQAIACGVNPYIFAALYVFSRLLVILGLYLALKSSGLSKAIKWKDVRKFNLKNINLKNRKVVIDLLIIFGSWISPDLYLLIAGRNLPLWIYLSIAGYVLMCLIFFIVKRLKEIKSHE